MNLSIQETISLRNNAVKDIFREEVEKFRSTEEGKAFYAEFKKTVSYDPANQNNSDNIGLTFLASGDLLVNGTLIEIENETTFHHQLRNFLWSIDDHLLQTTGKMFDQIKIILVGNVYTIDVDLDGTNNVEVDIIIQE